MIWIKAKPETLASNKRRKEGKDSDFDEEETNEDARKLVGKLAEERGEKLKLRTVYENEEDASRENMILEI
jgi:aminoglycoside phosphotransferase